MNRQEVSSIWLEEDRQLPRFRSVPETIGSRELGRFDDLAAAGVQPKNGDLSVPRVEVDDFILVAAEVDVGGSGLDALDLRVQLQRTQPPDGDTGVTGTQQASLRETHPPVGMCA